MAASLRVSALREGLQAAGYREPDNIELLQRAAEGDPKRDNRTVGERGRRGKQKGILQIRPNRIDSTSGLTRSLRNSPAQRHFCGDREKFLGAGIGWLEMLGSCEFKRRRKVTDEGLTATWE